MVLSPGTRVADSSTGVLGTVTARFGPTIVVHWDTERTPRPVPMRYLRAVGHGLHGVGFDDDLAGVNDDGMMKCPACKGRKGVKTCKVCGGSGRFSFKKNLKSAQAKLTARERVKQVFTDAIDAISQDPGFQELGRKNIAAAKEAKLKAGWQRFKVGQTVHSVNRESIPWPGVVKSAAYRENDIDGPGWYYEVRWWNAKANQHHDDYVHQDLLTAQAEGGGVGGTSRVATVRAAMKAHAQFVKQLIDWGFVLSQFGARDQYNREAGDHWQFPAMGPVPRAANGIPYVHPMDGGVYSGANRDKSWILVVLPPVGTRSSFIITERVENRPNGYQRSLIRSYDRTGFELAVRDIGKMLVDWDMRHERGQN